MPPPNTTEPTPYDHETITVADSAIGCTAATSVEASRAEMTLETAAIRMWDDGTAPTASVGELVQIGSRIILKSPIQITNFKAIRVGITSAKLTVQYFK